MAALTTYGTDGLLATTLSKYRTTLEDNVFGAKPLLWALTQAGRIEDFHGDKLVVPLLYGEAVNHGSYSGSEVFTTSTQTGISAAEFDWKQYYGLVYFTGLELAKNSGPQALISLMKARLTQVEMTIAGALNTMLWGDGTGNSSKDFMGLEGIANDATNTIGDIDRSSYSWWEPQRVNEGGTLALSSMRTTYNDASEGVDQPSNIFTTQSGYEVYEGLIQANQRFTDSKMGDAGFQNLLFKGAPVTFDRDVSANLMVFANLKYLTLGKLNGKWFEPSDLAKPVNQDVWFKTILLYGNFVVSNSARQGTLYGITDA